MKTPKVASKGNVAKHTSYTWAIEQMKKAHAAGFFLETVTIAESILSDRIWSHVKGTVSESLHARDTTLGKIATYKNVFKSAAPADLYQDVVAWNDRRNKLIHGIVKSDAGTPPMALNDYRSMAEETAAKALELVRAVDRWHKEQLRAHLARTRSK